MKRQIRKISDPKPYQPEEPTRPMSIRAQALRNIILFVLVYAGLWWIAVEVVK